MKYSVIWTPRALSELAQAWLEVSDRAAATAASHTIDRVLSENPFDARHEVVDGKGVAVRRPLGVDFVVREADRIVSITSAWIVMDQPD